MSEDTRLSRRTVLKLLGTGAVATAAGTTPALGASVSGGDTAYWTTGEQYGVGTVADHRSDDPSRAWFTLTEGALTQLRFPRIDLVNVRTVDLVVVDIGEESVYAKRTFDSSRRDDDSLERSVAPTATDALLFEHTVTETAGDRDWTVTAEYTVHPERDAVLADVEFSADDSYTYDVYLVVNPSLSNSGMADTAAVRSYRTGPGSSGNAGNRGNSGNDNNRGNSRTSAALTAADDGSNDGDAVILDPEGNPYNVALGVVAASGFDWASVGLHVDDPLSRIFNGSVPPSGYDEASGNVILVGRLAAGTTDAAETVALGFAEDADEDAAFEEARGALDRPFEATRGAYAASWRRYLGSLSVPDSVAGDTDLHAQFKTAAMVLKAADSKRFPGGGIASPSIPWGDAVVANAPSDYGYNYVWARDLYQAYTALEAMGDVESATEAVEYIYGYQQRETGFIPQNTFLDGRTRWGGEQMDNVSFPQLMAYQLNERHGVGFDDVDYDYENVRRSADYVVANGPATGQERWEEEGGYSPSTTAAEIAGLVGAAGLADGEDERADALVYLALADHWQANLETWMATEEPPELEEPDDIGEEYDVDYTTFETPYYFRINDDRDTADGTPLDINNGGPALDERAVVDAGFLELVRLGVKPWDDRVVRNSLALVDETIRVETPNGPAWYRYTEDGYGEQGRDDADDLPPGAPWGAEEDYGGRGRLWPIFTGERAEYELRAGTTSGDVEPATLLRTMQRFANDGRMIPEQVWDREEPTAFGWEFGEGTGSATPLSWSMAQFVRLAHALDEGEPVETPGLVYDRYVEGDRVEGPSLDVDFPPRVVYDPVVRVSGETDAAEVVVKTGAETVRTAVSGESFEVDVDVSEGDSQLTVVAATEGDVETVGTTLARESIAFVDLGDPVDSWDDPTGDDHGPGSYTYPTGSVYEDGVFDIASFEIYETDDRYQFLVELAGPLTNPWGGNAISLQFVQLYVRDPSQSDGSTDAREGVYATFAEPYHYRVLVQGFAQPVVETAGGETVTTDLSQTALGPLDTIVFEVPKSAFDGRLDEMQLVPLLFGQDGFDTGSVRHVAADASESAFGGGRDDTQDPNVIDLVTPPDVTQAEALAYSETERATIPYLDVGEALEGEGGSEGS